MSLIRSTAWSALGAVLLSVGRVLTVAVLARKLDVPDFGRLVFSQWIADMAFILLGFGLNGAGSRYFAEFQSQRVNMLRFQSWFARGAFVVVLCVGTAAPVAAWAFGQHLSPAQLALQSIWSACSAAWGLLISRAYGLARFKQIVLSNSVLGIVGVAGALACPTHASDSLTFALATMTLSNGLAVLCAWRTMDVKQTATPVEAPISYPRLAGFAFNVWISGVVSAFVWSRGELSIVRLQRTLEETAHYSAALSLSSISISGITMLTGALTPHITSLWGARRYEEGILLSRRFTDCLLLVSGVLGAFIICFAAELLRVCFGTKYSQSFQVLSILGVGSVGFAAFACNLLTTLKTDARFNRNANTCAAGVLIALALVLVPARGADGAAISRSAVLMGVGLAAMLYTTLAIDRRAVSWPNVAITFATVLAACAVLNQTELPLALRAASFLVSSALLAIFIRDSRERVPVSMVLLARVRALLRAQGIPSGSVPPGA